MQGVFSYHGYHRLLEGYQANATWLSRLAKAVQVRNRMVTMVI